MIPLDPPLRRIVRLNGVVDDTTWRRILEWVPETAKAQVDFAHGILELQPHSLPAMDILARHAGSEFEHAAIVREAVRIGQRLWAPHLTGEADEPEWGTNPETRPFLAFVVAYAEILVAEGNQDEASQCLGLLLKLDPNDSIGAINALEKAGLVQPAVPGMRMT